MISSYTGLKNTYKELNAKNKLRLSFTILFTKHKLLVYNLTSVLSPNDIKTLLSNFPEALLYVRVRPF